MTINHLGIVVADVKNWTAGVLKVSSCLVDRVERIGELDTVARVGDRSTRKDYGRVTQSIQLTRDRNCRENVITNIAGIDFILRDWVASFNMPSQLFN